MDNISTTGVPFISVIIPYYKDPKGLENLIRSFEVLEYGGNCEVIVCDNEVDSGIDRILPSSSRFVYCKELKAGSYAARNAGVAVAKGDVYAFIDSDCRVHSDYLSVIGELFSDMAVSLVAGPVTISSDRGSLNAWGLIDHMFAFHVKAMVQNGSAVTANLIVRANVFRAVGKFNSSLRSGGDTEWCLRARDHGIKMIYDSRIEVLHPPRTTRRAHEKKIRRVTAGLVERSFLLPEKYSTLRIARGLIIPPINRTVRLLGADYFSIFLRIRAVLAIWYLWIFRIVCFIPICFSRKHSSRFR